MLIFLLFFITLASINPLLDFDQMADNDTYANNENQHGISSLSIDVVRDTTSAMSSSRQQSVGSTKNDECVSVVFLLKGTN